MKLLIKITYLALTISLLNSCVTSRDYSCPNCAFNNYINRTNHLSSTKSIFYNNLKLDESFDKMIKGWGTNNDKLFAHFKYTAPLYTKGYLETPWFASYNYMAVSSDTLIKLDSLNQKKRFSLSAYFKELKHLENTKQTKDIYNVNFVIRDSVSNNIVYSKSYNITKSNPTVFSRFGEKDVTGKVLFEKLTSDLDNVTSLPEKNEKIKDEYDNLEDAKLKGKIKSDGYRFNNRLLFLSNYTFVKST